MPYQGPEARFLTREMARRGFVAVSVDYDNGAYAYCRGMAEKARCIFGREKTSAVSALCSRSNVDCERGVLVAGFSQGANLGLLAKNYDARVRGAYLMGLGHKAANFMDLSACMRVSETAFRREELRAINGEHDGFFGATAEGVTRQLTWVLGNECKRVGDCLQPDGSGWYVVHDAQLDDHTADHCYFLNRANGFCSKYEGLDPAWEKGREPWGVRSSLEWLIARLSHRK